MARSTTSNEQPSPPFYRGQRVTKHNHHKAIIYQVSGGESNPQITDAVTQASAQIPRPPGNTGLRYGVDTAATAVGVAKMMRLVNVPISLP